MPLATMGTDTEPQKNLGVVDHAFNPSTGNQRQEDLWEFKPSLVYR